MTINDNDRDSLVVKMIEILGLETEERKLLKALPSAGADPENKAFMAFQAFLQLVAMLPAADEKNRCDILKDILAFNKHFKVELDAVRYYESMCRG